MLDRRIADAQARKIRLAPHALRCWVEDQWRDRLLVEVELLAQVAEDLHVLADGRPRIRSPVGLGVETPAVQEAVLDQLKQIPASAFEAVDESGCRVALDSAQSSC